MMTYISSVRQYNELTKDAEEFNKDVDKCVSNFFKKNGRIPVKDKEKAQAILDCRLGNFGR